MAYQFIDRSTGAFVEEIIEGDKLLKWMYRDSPFSVSTRHLVAAKLPSVLYGKLQHTRISRKKIQKFIDKHSINALDFEEAKETYPTFNDFFIRRLKPHARPLDTHKHACVSPADGRLLAYDAIDIDNLVQIKGVHYKLSELLDDEALSRQYQGGACIVIRLSPVDYHRFHYPDDGTIKAFRQIKGRFFSVNPIALKKVLKLYVQNKREYMVYESESFSELILMEVGATFVGSIVQHHNVGYQALKGEEKGYFHFGGSTVILFAKPNVLTIDADLLENTKAGYETKVFMGERIAIKK